MDRLPLLAMMDKKNLTQTSFLIRSEVSVFIGTAAQNFSSVFLFTTYMTATSIINYAYIWVVKEQSLNGRSHE